MNIKFDLKTSDYVFFYKRYYKKKILFFQPYIFLIGALIIVYLSTRAQTTLITQPNNFVIPKSIFESIVWIKWIYNTIIILGLIFLIRYLSIRRITNQINNNPHLIGLHELILEEDILVVKKINIKTEYNYKIFLGSEIVEKYCFLYLTMQSVIIIPVNGLESDNFIKALNEKINKR
jgi:hypothetical protein